MPNHIVLITVGALLLAGLAMDVVGERTRLPRVTLLVLIGIAAGPSGLDVLPKEPADPDHPLIRAFTAREEWLDHRLILTPHSAFFTPESVRDMRYKGGEVALAYLREGRLQNLVNGDYLPTGFGS